VTQPPEFLLEFGRQRGEFWKNPPRGTCPGCHAEDEVLHLQDEKLVCATCYRKKAFTAPAEDFTYPCDDCGGGKAFRDPLTREDIYRCHACHEKHGYIPGERAMISKIEKREGFTHSKGRRDKCIAADHGTDCQGQIKPRGKLGNLCDKHHNPKLFK
jgi:hypothetical protein